MSDFYPNEQFLQSPKAFEWPGSIFKLPRLNFLGMFESLSDVPEEYGLGTVIGLKQRYGPNEDEYRVGTFVRCEDGWSEIAPMTTVEDIDTDTFIEELESLSINGKISSNRLKDLLESKYGFGVTINPSLNEVMNGWPTTALYKS